METIKNFLSGIHSWWVDNVWKPSWTKFTSWVVGVPAVLVAGAQVVANMSNDPVIQNYLTQLHVPTWVPSTLAVIALVYYVASGRK